LYTVALEPNKIVMSKILSKIGWKKKKFWKEKKGGKKPNQTNPYSTSEFSFLKFFWEQTPRLPT